MTMPKSASFKITPALASFAINPASVLGAGAATGTVTLSDVAPAATDTLVDKLTITVDPAVCDDAQTDNTKPNHKTNAAVYIDSVLNPGTPVCSIAAFLIPAGQKSATVRLGTHNSSVSVAGVV